MDVILNKDIDGLGKSGQVVKVKDGFARNFLIPNGLVLPLNSQNQKKLEQEKQRKIFQSEKVKKEAEDLKERLAGLSLTIPVLVQDENKIYGSIAAAEIAHALEEEGFQIEGQVIILDEPIKSLGIYEIDIKLHPEVTARIKVWVVKK